MKLIKLSAIAVAIGMSSGMQEINKALKIADTFSYETGNAIYSRVNIDDIPIVVNGFPSFSQEADDIEFKIYRAGFVCYGYKIIQLIILCFDHTQAQRMAESFHSIINKQSSAAPPNFSNFKGGLVNEPISPEDVIDVASEDNVVYTMFLGKT